MRFLLDTHVLLRAAEGPDRLPPEALDLIENPATELVYSAVSIWEVAIKNGLGRADFRVDPRLLRRGLLEHGYTELPVTGDPCRGGGSPAADPQGSLRPPSGGAGADRGDDPGDDGRSGGALPGADPVGRSNTVTAV